MIFQQLSCCKSSWSGAREDSTTPWWLSLDLEAAPDSWWECLPSGREYPEQGFRLHSPETCSFFIPHVFWEDKLEEEGQETVDQMGFQPGLGIPRFQVMNKQSISLQINVSTRAGFFLIDVFAEQPLFTPYLALSPDAGLILHRMLLSPFCCCLFFVLFCFVF